MNLQLPVFTRATRKGAIDAYLDDDGMLRPLRLSPGAGDPPGAFPARDEEDAVARAGVDPELHARIVAIARTHAAVAAITFDPELHARIVAVADAAAAVRRAGGGAGDGATINHNGRGVDAGATINQGARSVDAGAPDKEAST